MRLYWPWLCALLSGALLAFSFPPADIDGFAWVALGPLIAALWFSPPWTKRDPLRLFLLGFLAGFVYFLGCFFWVTSVTVLGCFLLSGYLALYPALWALFVGTVARPREDPSAERPIWMHSWNNLRVAILAAAAWAALEWIRGTLFSGFGWNGLGITLHGNLALIQIADITGVGGLSFMLVMVNMMIVITLKRLRLEVGRHRLRPHYDFSLTVALVALVFGYGVRQIFAPAAPSETVKVAAIQANVPILERRDAAHEERILDLHLDLSNRALALSPDLLIWPEAATPRPIFSDQHTWDVVRGLSEKSTGDFLLGSVHFSKEGDYNSAVLLTNKAKTAQLYHKIHLVPFGEYVPLRHSFPIFVWLMGYLVPEDFDFGPEANVLQMASRPVKLGALICFEDTVGDLVRRFAQNGAQLYVNLTNDGWFLRSAESLQHLRQAVFRCAETKLPMVRSANTGITCVVDRFGRIQQTLTDEKGDTFIEGILVAPVPVPLEPRQTFYTRYGEIFSQACLGLTFLASALTFRRRKS